MVGSLGAYMARALGGVPQNLIGLLVGDWLIHKRVRRWSELYAETKRILDKRDVREPYEDISPSIALPLIEAALDEDREGLKELWAKLLAAALDPKRKDSVRRSVIEVAKALEPLDALVFTTFAQLQLAPGQYLRNVMTERLARGGDDIDVSIEALTKIGLIVASSHTTWYVSPLGKLLNRAIAD